MRFRQLALRVSEDDHVLRFHDRLTVVWGLTELERRELVEVLLGAMAGEPTRPNTLTWVDGASKTRTTVQHEDGTFASRAGNGKPAPRPDALLRLSVQELFDLSYVGARELGFGRNTTGEPKDLAEARAALAALTDELAAATVARDAARALRTELTSLQARLRDVETGRPRRRYARICLQLEETKLERAALTASPADVKVDEQWVKLARGVRPLTLEWRVKKATADEMRARFGRRPRLDAHTLAGALAVPDRVPPNIDALAADLRRAESEHLALSGKLTTLLSDHIERPSHPDVARLARADQVEVWAAAERALAASLELERESLRVGGILPDGSTAPIAEELDAAHSAVEHARQSMEKRRFGAMAAAGSAALGALAIPLAPVVAPLALVGAASAAYWAVLSPRQQLFQAQLWEEDTLSRIGVPSYLAFHLRKMDAMQDPELRTPLERAAAAHREAMVRWRHLAGDLAPATALALREEAENYSSRLAAIDDIGAEAEAVRRRLVEEVEPAVDKARERFMDVCRPFGIENPVLAVDLVRQLADVAKIARLQHQLEEAEAAEKVAYAPLDTRLNEIGIRGDIEERLATFETTAMQSEHRLRARQVRRPLSEVDAEIKRLHDMANAEYRPEFGATVDPADAVEPDPDELQRRRDLTATALQMASRLVPDVNLIADRRSALERRVEVLEQSYSALVGSITRPSEVEPYLADRLNAVQRVGAAGESLPLLLDEVFANVRADQKWTLLDIVDRLAGEGQIVYLTEDPDVERWARRRASTGAVIVAEPAPRPLVG